MSIRRAAYDLCKSVWSSAIRVDAQTTIRNLNTATEEQQRTGNHRASFGQAARHLRAQLMGYLFVHRDKERLENNYPPLRGTAGLTEGEKRILDTAHRQLEELNKKCTSRLVELDPNCGPAVNPYFKYGYQIPEDVENVPLFDVQLADTLVDSFRKHPAISVALESGEKFRAAVPEAQRPSVTDIAQAVLNLEKGLLVAGPLHAPRQLWELLVAQRPGAPNQAWLDYCCALTCINASLATLDELLYQAIISNRLPTLDDDSIIDIGNVVGTWASTGFTIKYQPTEESGFGNLGLILVKAEIIDRRFDLCRVEAVEVRVSEEFGDTVDITVREIDENLNPYSHLLPRREPR